MLSHTKHGHYRTVKSCGSLLPLCQIAETPDWQPSGDANCRDQKAWLGSISGARQVCGESCRQMHWRPLQLSHRGPIKNEWQMLWWKQIWCEHGLTVRTTVSGKLNIKGNVYGRITRAQTIKFNQNQSSVVAPSVLQHTVPSGCILGADFREQLSTQLVILPRCKSKSFTVH